jgi:predicted RND superfamily exporter protein
MAKGVVFGLLCVIILFPALLLVFDKQIEKTKHKNLLPEFNGIKNFVLNHNKAIFIIFIILLIPAYIAQSKTPVYYKLDSSIPDSYGYTKATKELQEKYNMMSQSMIIMDKDIEDYKVNQMIEEIDKLDGIGAVLSASSLSKLGLPDIIIPEKFKEMYQNDKYKLVIVSSHYDIATDELNNQIGKLNKIVDKYDSSAIVAGEGPLMKDLVKTTKTDLINVNYTSIIVIAIIMLLTLKSISLPVLLVTAIEFAIFVNMGVPFLTNTPIPFVASIVIGTIQLGATIDYAILMTTKYIEERKKGTDKKQACKIALDSSVSSIFVSGMCFFGATFGVGVISTIDMIGTLCTLLARGAVVSMIVVIFVLPSILLLFDKLITKTTLGFKKGRI